jgi:CheY-like chemotaxis protein
MRILAIDDDPATLELLRSVLVANGYGCLTASGAEQALRLLEANPDILVAISDISMPGMDGITLLERINSQSPPGAAPRVVFLTAHASVDYAVAALRLGAMDFLTKPLRPQNVLTVIRSAIQSVVRQRDRPMAVQRCPGLPGKTGAHPASVALLGMDHLRRLRRDFPPLGDLDDVAWDLLRELVRAGKSGERLSVSSLSMAAEQVSSSTAVRRIQELARTGLIVRSPDPTDARRDFVALASEMQATLERYLERVAWEFAAAAGAAS